MFVSRKKKVEFSALAVYSRDALQHRNRSGTKKQERLRANLNCLKL